ncbi:PucR family transcriptional regulator ligand-binding domain-containing protein [Streptomyces thinghirensis]|nr:PucR family transcriptional regulator ligand-binding domain-containing protein [Streptomyces thinghirensis]
MSENQRRAPVPEGRPLTVADVLALPVLAGGDPRVVTGRDHTDRPVRWVHITELTDPASFLKGGELVLTTGMPLPDDPAGVRRYVDELADVGAAALVIELVRRYHRPPDALVQACRSRGLPLVTLAKDVNFLEVTQVVHTLILGSQADAMRRTQRVHEAFTAPHPARRRPRGRGARRGGDERAHGRAGEPGPPGDGLRTLRQYDGGRAHRLGTAFPGHPARRPHRSARPRGLARGPGGVPGRGLGTGGHAPPARTTRPRPRSSGPRTSPCWSGPRWPSPSPVSPIPRPGERTAHRNALRDLVEQRHRSPRTRVPGSRRWGCPPSTPASSPHSWTSRRQRTPPGSRSASPRN